MGLAKSEMMEIDERGWSDVETFVCDNCVEDEYLKNLITSHLEHNECDYCKRESTRPIAAAFAMLIEPIAETVFYFYNEPTQAGVPYDGGFVVDGTDTADVLMSLPLNCADNLFEDIAGAFCNDCWVRAAGGHWASSHEHEILQDSWGSFVHAVKHDTRFFFVKTKRSNSAGPQEFAPRHMLPTLGKLVLSLRLVKELPADGTFYRVRERARHANWSINAENMGAPPPRLARAGRMNPAGISYLYLAFDRATAVAEVLQAPPITLAIAQFKNARKLAVLDFSNLPPLPSLFDSTQRMQREKLLFLKRFVEEISEPVRKDGREHIDYVPSQIVTEYFAQVCRTSKRKQLDGIIYPSAVRPGSRNLVLFPTEIIRYIKSHPANFHSADEINFLNWNEVNTELS